MDTFESLIRDVRDLRARFSLVADQLMGAAENLKNSGVPLSDDLTADLDEVRTSFERIRERFLNLSIRPGADGGVIRSLEHLEELLFRAKAEADDRRDHERRDEALRLVERATRLRHVDAAARHSRRVGNG